MSFASVGTFGTANSSTSTTTLALTPSATLEVGNLAVLIVAMDNQASEGALDEFGRLQDTVTSVTDTGSNVWRCLGTNQGTNATAAAASAVSVFCSTITTQLTGASTVTITFSGAIVSKAATGWEFTTAGNVNIESVVRAFGVATDPGSMTLDDLPNREYLLIRGIACETNSTSFTPTTNYTGFTNAVGNSGAAGTSMSADGEFRILTGTSDSSDPTKAAVDNSSVYVALFEGDASIPVITHASFTQVAVTGITALWPQPHKSGDIALLICESAGGEAVTLTTANGFAAVTNSPQDTSETRLTVFWCRATSDAMSAPVVADPGNHLGLRMFLVQQCVATGDPWDITVGSAKDTPSTSVSITGGTTTVADTLVLAIASIGTDNIADEFSTWANASLTRFRELDYMFSSTGTGGGWNTAIGRKAAAGTVDATTATITTTSDNANLLIAFKPAPAGSAATVTPAVIAATVTLPTPTVLAASVVTPTVIAAVAALPTPTILAAAKVTPAVIAATAALPTPTILAAAKPTPTVIAAVASLPTPTILAAAIVTPAVIPVTVTLPTPTVIGGTAVSPAVIAVTVSLPTPTIQAAATVTPTVIAATVSLPTPTVLAAATVTPAVIAVTVTIPTPTINVVGGPVTVSPAVIAATVSLPTPIVSVPVTVTPAVIAVTVTLPTPTVTAGAVVTPAVIPVTVSLLTPNIFIQGADQTVTPAVIAATADLPTPTILAAVTVTPSTIAVLVGLPTPTIFGETTVKPATIVVTVTFPGPVIIIGAMTFWTRRPVAYSLAPVGYTPVTGPDEPPWN